MKIETKKLLYDVQTACTEILAFISGKTRAEYLDDILLRRAVERDVEIIGEALSLMRTIDATSFERIPDASRIVGMRHRLIHGYAQVNDDIVWDAVQLDIPPLLQLVQDLLAE
jgi:uncharacterized protein with HEPN domain